MGEILKYKHPSWPSFIEIHWTWLCVFWVRKKKHTSKTSTPQDVPKNNNRVTRALKKTEHYVGNLWNQAVLDCYVESKILIRTFRCNIQQRILFHHNPDFDFGALSIFAAASFARFSASVLFWDTIQIILVIPNILKPSIYTVFSWWFQPIWKILVKLLDDFPK